MKKLTAILLILAVTVFAFAACTDNTDKTETVTSGTSGTSGVATEPDITQSETKEPTLLEKLTNGFKLTLSVKDQSAQVVPYDIDMSLVCDSTNSKALFSAKLTDTDGEGIDLGVYADKGVLAVSEPTLLGGAYGVCFDTLADDFAKSVFAPDSGSSFALDEETYAQASDFLANLTGTEGGASVDSEKMAEKFTEYAEFLLDLVKKQVKIEQANGVMTVKVFLDNESLADIIDALAKKIETDEELKDLFGDFMSDTATDEEPNGFDDSLGSISLKDIADEIRNGDAFTFEFEGTFSETEGKCTVSVDGEKVLGAEYKFAENKIDARLYAFDGETDNDVIVIEGTKSGDDVKVTVTYIVDGETAATVVCEIKGTALVLTAEADGVKYVVYGTIDITDDYAMFGINKIEVTAEGMSATLEISAVIKLEAGFEPFSAPEYKNIFLLGEDEMTELLAMFGGIGAPAYPDDIPDCPEFTDDVDIPDYVG